MSAKVKPHRFGNHFLITAVCLAATVRLSPAAASEGEASLRCVAFYSRINGVNSTIYQVVGSIEQSLGEDDDVSLSVYHLESDYYNSLEYKVKAAAAMDADVLILNEMPEGTPEYLLEKLCENEIHVLIVDGQPSEYEYSSCIATDNYGAGKDVARMLEEGERLSAAEADYTEIRAGIVATLFRVGDISASRAERRDGFQDEAGKYEDFETFPVCVCSSDMAESLNQIRDYLSEYPDMNVLFCLDSASGILASKVLMESGRQDEISVICFDRTEQVQEEMRQGGIDFVVEQDTGQIGRECADFLRQMARWHWKEAGEDVDEPMPDMLREVHSGGIPTQNTTILVPGQIVDRIQVDEIGDAEQ